MKIIFREIKCISQEPGPYTRRWFTCDTSDFFVWENKDNSLVKFQLSFTNEENENILTWTLGKGIKLSAISNNFSKIGIRKGSPILEENNDCNFTDFKNILLNNGSSLDITIINFVLEKLARPEGFEPPTP